MWSCGASRSPIAQPWRAIIELTSYAEVVLATPAADEAHPAFSNLFVQTEFVQSSSAILCTRRARSQEEKPPWLLHLMVEQAADPGRSHLLRNRSLPICRTRRNPGQPGRDAERFAVVQHRRVRARSHCFAAAHGLFAARMKPPSLTWFWALPKAGKPHWRRWKNTKAPAWLTVSSIWPGPTAR